ncbi:MAG: hypothetical protein RDV41_09245 [Planctomycetota bacterium]|nr:hypothetical protein [Planctomycetota bacterium]
MRTLGALGMVRAVGAGILLLCAIAVVAPLLVVAQGQSNEQRAVGTLRTLVTQENLWHKMDADGNGTNDYWTIDVAGMYRAIRQPSGTEAMMVDVAVARSDWSPDGAGDGGGGEFPLVAVAYAADTQVPGLAAMAQTAPIPKSGYYVAAFRNDAASVSYAVDLDGAGQAYENTSRFAFMAFPENYGATGKNAFIVDASGVVWRIDAALGKYNLPAGPVNATLPANGTAPLTEWPNANPAKVGYAQADGLEESALEQDDEENESFLEEGSACPVCGHELESSIAREDLVRKLKPLLDDLQLGLDDLRDRDCLNNLKRLGLYITLWVTKFGAECKYPGPGLKLLFDLYNHPSQKLAIITSRGYGLLVCKRSGDKAPKAELVTACNPSCTSYECTKDQLDDTCSPDKPIVWDKKPVHDGSRHVLCFDGSVLSLTEERFQKELKEHEGKK